MVEILDGTTFRYMYIDIYSYTSENVSIVISYIHLRLNGLAVNNRQHSNGNQSTYINVVDKICNFLVTKTLF